MLFRSALRVMSIHNVHFLVTLMRRMREAIKAGRAAAFARETLEAMREGDEVGPADPASGRPAGAPAPRPPRR